MALSVPLNSTQIEAAGRVHQQLEQWRRSDDALIRLRGDMPGFDAEVCLLKALAVNSLYGTQVFAIIRMAKHVYETLRSTDPAVAGPELVERIAELPADGDKRSRSFVSFAAKFCHFFVSDERFPIYDEAARSVLKLHLGKEASPRGVRWPYREFCRAFEQLREECGHLGNTRDLDRYLWLTGMYRKWGRERHKRSPVINAELRQAFRSPSTSLAAELQAILPEPILDEAGGL